MEETTIEADFLEPVNILMEKMSLKNLNPESRVKQCHQIRLKNQVFYSSRYPRTSKMNSYTLDFRNCIGDVCYGEIAVYVIVDNFPMAMVRPLKITNKSVLEVDEELESHAILKRYAQQQSFKKSLATHIKLVNLRDKYMNLVAIPVTDLIKKCVYGENQINGYATISCFSNFVEHD